MVKRTLKRYNPQNNIYVYARECGSKTELIILNSTNDEQELLIHHYHEVIQGSRSGKELGSGKRVDLTKNMRLTPRQSLIIEL